MAIEPWQMEIWQTFLRAHHRVIRQLDRELRDHHDLPLEWYDVLLQLNSAGGRLKMGELAEAVLVTAPNCTRLVDRLEKANLVERTVDPQDRRARQACITASGRKLLRRAAATHLEGIERHFTSKLPNHQTSGAADELRATLARIVAGLEPLDP